MTSYVSFPPGKIKIVEWYSEKLYDNVICTHMVHYDLLYLSIIEYCSYYYKASNKLYIIMRGKK